MGLFARNAPIVVVSGLPRSGTSMLMRMLEAGGLAVVSDGARSADDDNPRGYFEDERVKRLGPDAEIGWLAEAEGKALKVVSPLLRELPSSFRYLVIFQQRDLSEVLASQAKMLERAGAPRTENDEEMQRSYEKHLAGVRRWLEAARAFELLELSYAAVVDAPAAAAQRIADFVATGVGRRLDVEAMAEAVDPTLYRNRQPTR